jgi:tetratricopeptide (TPR) repeat protein
VALDRETILKKADKLIRQGKLDGAIEEYVRLVEDQPQDWNSINALGDLYARVGDADRAVAQFTRIADYLFDEGFYPKAAAVYKKALKVRSNDEHTLVRLSEIATRQGRLADAKVYLRQLAEQRRSSGDEQTAAEYVVRLGTLDQSDPESKVAAAKAAQQLGDLAGAAVLLQEAADAFEQQGRRGAVIDALIEASQLDPDNVLLRARIARECVQAGDLDRAQPFLTPEIAAEDADLLLALARIALESASAKATADRSERDAEARATLTRLLTLAPARHAEVMKLADRLAAEGRTETAFGCVDVVTDAAILDANWPMAIDALQSFLRHGPHIPALMKLVEVCVDAGLEDAIREAQARLVDACLEQGRGAEARVIAEDLVAHDPHSEANIARLRRALELMGITDADRMVAERAHSDQDVVVRAKPQQQMNPITPELQALLDMDFGDLETGDALPANPSSPRSADEPPPTSDVGETFVLESAEVDLTDALRTLGTGGTPPVPPAPAGPAPDLEAVFEDMRSRVGRDQKVMAAAEQYERGLRCLDDGNVEDAIRDLRTAARAPQWRFKAASTLGRIYVDREDFQHAVEWFEHAAEAPAPTQEEGLAVLYDLAVALDRLGEGSRALAVLIELEANAGTYRDVRGRIERLTRVQWGAGGE